MKPRLLFALWLLSTPLSGCVSMYQHPTPGEPHAMVKLRRTYEKRQGDKLFEGVFVNDAVAFGREAFVSSMVDAPSTDAILIRPGPSQLRIHARFLTKILRKSEYNRDNTIEYGKCMRRLAFNPEPGHSYVIDFTYRENGLCSVTCLEQVASTEGGKFELVPCAQTLVAGESS